MTEESSKNIVANILYDYALNYQSTLLSLFKKTYPTEYEESKTELDKINNNVQKLQILDSVLTNMSVYSNNEVKAISYIESLNNLSRSFVKAMSYSNYEKLESNVSESKSNYSNANIDENFSEYLKKAKEYYLYYIDKLEIDFGLIGLLSNYYDFFKNETFYDYDSDIDISKYKNLSTCTELIVNCEINNIARLLYAYEMILIYSGTISEQDITNIEKMKEASKNYVNHILFVKNDEEKFKTIFKIANKIEEWMLGKDERLTLSEIKEKDFSTREEKTIDQIRDFYNRNVYTYTKENDKYYLFKTKDRVLYQDKQKIREKIEKLKSESNLIIKWFSTSGYITYFTNDNNVTADNYSTTEEISKYQKMLEIYKCAINEKVVKNLKTFSKKGKYNNVLTCYLNKLCDGDLDVLKYSDYSIFLLLYGKLGNSYYTSILNSVIKNISYLKSVYEDRQNYIVNQISFYDTYASLINEYILKAKFNKQKLEYIRIDKDSSSTSSDSRTADEILSSLMSLYNGEYSTFIASCNIVFKYLGYQLYSLMFTTYNTETVLDSLTELSYSSMISTIQQLFAILSNNSNSIKYVFESLVSNMKNISFSSTVRYSPGISLSCRNDNREIETLNSKYNSSLLYDIAQQCKIKNTKFTKLLDAKNINKCIQDILIVSGNRYMRLLFRDSSINSNTNVDSELSLYYKKLTEEDKRLISIVYMCSIFSYPLELYLIRNPTAKKTEDNEKFTRINRESFTDLFNNDKHVSFSIPDSEIESFSTTSISEDRTSNNFIDNKYLKMKHFDIYEEITNNGTNEFFISPRTNNKVYTYKNGEKIPVNYQSHGVTREMFTDFLERRNSLNRKEGSELQRQNVEGFISNGDMGASYNSKHDSITGPALYTNQIIENGQNWKDVKRNLQETGRASDGTNILGAGPGDTYDKQMRNHIRNMEILNSANNEYNTPEILKEINKNINDNITGTPYNSMYNRGNQTKAKIIELPDRAVGVLPERFYPERTKNRNIYKTKEIIPIAPFDINEARLGEELAQTHSIEHLSKHKRRLPISQPTGTRTIASEMNGVIPSQYNATVGRTENVTEGFVNDSNRECFDNLGRVMRGTEGDNYWFPNKFTH